MHPRNIHRNGYDFSAMSATYPKLKPFLIKNPIGNISINFSDPAAVKALNAALLAHYYDVKNWNIPAGHLCPPVPGRADYIHYIADLLAEDTTNLKDFNSVSADSSIVGLDIGAGANLIYPILASQIYNWRIIGSELNKDSIDSANKILLQNAPLSNFISLRQQPDSKCIFSNIIRPEDRFDFTMCNPPFHASKKLAEQGSQRKNQNLARNKLKRHQQKHAPFSNDRKLNFAGKSNELWCKGGEIAFIKQMAMESQNFADQVKWFTSLLSKKDNIKPIYRLLRDLNVKQIKTVQMGQGNKKSRFIAWQF